eukprot:Nk52_evm71s164 gene=Nk52_evmTU71s164
MKKHIISCPLLLADNVCDALKEAMDNGSADKTTEDESERKRARKDLKDIFDEVNSQMEKANAVSSNAHSEGNEGGAPHSHTSGDGSPGAGGEADVGEQGSDNEFEAEFRATLKCSFYARK